MRTWGSQLRVRLPYTTLRNLAKAAVAASYGVSLFRMAFGEVTASRQPSGIAPWLPDFGPIWHALTM